MEQDEENYVRIFDDAGQYTPEGIKAGVAVNNQIQKLYDTMESLNINPREATAYFMQEFQQRCVNWVRDTKPKPVRTTHTKYKHD